MKVPTSAAQASQSLIQPVTVPVKPVTTSLYEYHVMVAEPVSDEVWVLEYRYPDGEWQTWGVYETEEAMYDAMLWPALHLIVELRHYTETPQPQYELLAIVNTQHEAQAMVNASHAMGLWSYYVRRLKAFQHTTLRR